MHLLHPQGFCCMFKWSPPLTPSKLTVKGRSGLKLQLEYKIIPSSTSNPLLYPTKQSAMETPQRQHALLGCQQKIKTEKQAPQNHLHCCHVQLTKTPQSTSPSLPSSVQKHLVVAPKRTTTPSKYHSNLNSSIATPHQPNTKITVLKPLKSSKPTPPYP